MGMMSFPQLQVIRGTKEVTYWGEGALKYYINDNEATWAQVLAIPPKDVIRIEYIDRPDLEYTQGENIGVVIRFITKKYERGVFNSFALDKPINRNTLGSTIESRIKYFNNEYAFNYQGNYEHSGKSIIMSSNRQTYNLENGIIRRWDKDIGHGHGKSFNNNLSFAFFHNDRKNYLSINASYSDYNEPRNINYSQSFDSSRGNDTISRHTWNKTNNQNFSARIRYHRTQSDHFGYNANLAYAYGMRKSDYLYHDLQSPDTLYTLSRNTDARSPYLNGSIGAWYKISAHWTVQSAVVELYNYGHTLYHGNYTGLSRNRSNNLSWQNRIAHSCKNFSDAYNITLVRSTTKNFRGTSDNKTYMNFATNGRYTFNSTTYLGYNFYYTPTTVPRSAISTEEVILNQYQSRRGNMHLKNGYNIRSSINGGILLLKHINVAANVIYNYYNNNPRESAIEENNRVVRLPMNFDIHEMKYSAEFALQNVKHVYGSFVIGQNRYWSKNVMTQDKYHYNRLYMRLNGTVELGPWDLSVDWWNHNNEFFGETMFTSGRGLDFTIERTWLRGQLSTALTLTNPLTHNYSREYTKNYSKVAPYVNRNKYLYAPFVLQLNVVYKFSFGKRVSTERVSTGISTNSGSISTSNTDKK